MAGQRVRTGVTPVVSVVLLMMLTVGVAGGAYAWLDGIVQEQYRRATETVNRDVQMKGLYCKADANPDVEFFLKNMGSTDVDTSDVTVYLYRFSDGKLLEGVTKVPNQDLTTDERTWEDTIAFDHALKEGHAYTIEFEFTNENGYVLTERCTAS